MSILTFEQLSKSYGDKDLFNDLTFTISNGQRIGLIGVNGTGKSTLLKIIAGIESGDTGSKKHAKDFAIEYLTQEPELNSELPVLEQIYYGDSEIMTAIREYEEVLQQLAKDPENPEILDKMMSKQQKMDHTEAWEANTAAKTILTKLGIEIFDQKIGQLSGGQKKRVAIAKALIQPADLLLLDEPTNHLDNETIEWLEEYLSHYKGALIVVTHDRYFLNRVSNLIYELDKGRLFTYQGNYETFLEKKAEREEWERQAEQKHQNTLRRELAWLKRGAKARTTKQKARKQRVEEMQDQTFTNEKSNVDMSIGSTRLGNDVIELKNISHTYGAGTLLEHFNYLVITQERIGIIGPNGSGKTTLLNIMAGRVTPDHGEISVGSTVKIGYYTQDHEEIDGSLKVIEYIKEAAEVITTAEGEVITAEQMLERFLFPRSHQWTYIQRLSGGERRRLYLLRVLMTEPNVLFLDEPTNDLDTETLSVLEEYLEHFPGVVITVSHDRYFLDRVVEKLLAFKGEGEVERFYGNYSEYLEKTKAEKTVKTKEKPSFSAQRATRRSNRKRKLSYREQQEWESIEDEIAAIEEKIDQINKEMAAAAADYSKVEELSKEKAEHDQELEQKMERWEELSIIIEEMEEE
ncbi:ABC-F family ATP-binding cassette domain-containing protein [Halobacillus massiliensis]|uniref:ABC-F family ATP-binding cassette domain-containing protein n=1 Tax=Halobacillus massiliensis TaxID=1926286 RepID=UPI0009E626B0|nr:ABC-F family ATP-binding cassette domain-containing protein [Halobacillus massiliensis]